MFNVSIALYWTKLAALVSALLSAVGVLSASPFLGIILFLLFQELSELAMTMYLRDSIEDDE